MRSIERLDLIWSGEEISDYERLRDKAEDSGEELPAFVKRVLRLHLRLR